MARGDALKRISPTSFESDGGEGSAKKLKISVDVASEAATTVRSGPLEAEESGSDPIKAGEDTQTSTLPANNGINRAHDDGEQGGDLYTSPLAVVSCFRERRRPRGY